MTYISRISMTLIALTLTAITHAGAWYAGDLHSHSLHSDGDSPVAAVLASAESHGLDFFALTDHDTSMAGAPTHWYDPNYASNTMVLLYGVEWTSIRGHANAWSDAPFDYAELWTANRTRNPQWAADAAHAQGALFSINHPLRLGWEYPVVAGVDCIEVWNGPMLINSNLAATHAFWDNELRSGRRIVGVGGSDTHHLVEWMAPFTGHGYPTTWVYAEEWTAAGILDGIAAGRVSISATPDAARLDLLADSDDDGVYETLIGDTLIADGRPAAFVIAIADGAAVPGTPLALGTARARDTSGVGAVLELPPGLVDRMERGRLSFWDRLWVAVNVAQMQTRRDLRLLTFVRDGAHVRAWVIAGDVATVAFDELPTAATRFYRAELYGQPNVTGLAQFIYGNRLALTNPIYVAE